MIAFGSGWTANGYFGIDNYNINGEGYVLGSIPVAPAGISAFQNALIFTRN